MDKQFILSRLDLQSFYSREIPSLKWNSSGWGQGLCCFHDDHRPSFFANKETGAWNCKGCNTHGSLFDFYMARHSTDFRGAIDALAREAGVDTRGAGTEKKTNASGKIVKTYPYTDKSGNLLFQVVRYEPKTFRQRRPDGKGGWISNLEGVRLVPFNLPEVIKAKSVIVVEGEKDAETLRAWGLTATTNAQGAGKWRREYSEHLKGKRVVVLPDNDEPGRKHAEAVARSLYGVAEIVKVVELPIYKPEGKDVTDWRDRKGGTKEQLLELIQQAPEWTPPAEIPEVVEAGPEQGESPAPRIRVVSIADFLSMEFPPRENLLSPILPTQGLVMVHAYRGVGKTHVSLGMAVAVASGGKFLRWEAPKPQGVLFLDGEMPAVTIKDRLSHSIVHAEKEIAAPFHIITPDLQDHGSMPDLSTPEGQLDLEPYLQDVSLVIVDNVSTLCRTGRENEAESWLPVQGWALRLRAMGKSVFFVVHEGKSGTQRGTSKREDVLDTVLSLKRPKDYRPEEGARFEVHYEKHRGFYGDDAKPFEAKLTTELDGRLTWTTKDLEQSLMERVADLLNDGIPQSEIAEMVGTSKGNVSKLKKKAQAQGLLTGSITVP